MSATDDVSKKTIDRIESVAFFDIRRLYDQSGKMLPPHKWDDATAAAISHVGPSGPVPCDRMAALEKLMRHYGLYERDNGQRGESLSLKVELVE